MLAKVINLIIQRKCQMIPFYKLEFPAVFFVLEGHPVCSNFGHCVIYFSNSQLLNADSVFLKNTFILTVFFARSTLFGKYAMNLKPPQTHGIVSI